MTHFIGYSRDAILEGVAIFTAKKHSGALPPAREPALAGAGYVDDDSSLDYSAGAVEHAVAEEQQLVGLARHL